MTERNFFSRLLRLDLLLFFLEELQGDIPAPWQVQALAREQQIHPTSYDLLYELQTNPDIDTDDPGGADDE